jgi:hypothetical protein
MVSPYHACFHTGLPVRKGRHRQGVMSEGGTLKLFEAVLWTRQQERCHTCRMVTSGLHGQVRSAGDKNLEIETQLSVVVTETLSPSIPPHDMPKKPRTHSQN